MDEIIKSFNGAIDMMSDILEIKINRKCLTNYLVKPKFFNSLDLSQVYLQCYSKNTYLHNSPGYLPLKLNF